MASRDQASAARFRQPADGDCTDHPLVRRRIAPDSWASLDLSRRLRIISGSLGVTFGRC
jgi:hypothetical protein